MAFEVETGTGSATANSYASTAELDTYANDRGKTTWSAKTSTEKQVALVNASDYIDASFSFVGSRKTSTQAMSWPRTDAVDSDEGISIANTIIPSGLKRACMELAGKFLDGEILLQDYERGGKISAVKVGPISVSYDASASAETVYSITKLLKGLLVDKGPGALLDPIEVVASEDTDFAFTSGMFDNGS